MRHGRTVIGGFLVALMVAAGCADDAGDALAPTTTTTLAPTTVAPTTTAPTTTAPTTTAATASTVPDSTTTTAALAGTTTSIDFDTTAPDAPTNLSCSAGGGSLEVQIEWDTPADPADIHDVRLYLDEGSGFARIDTIRVSSGAVMTGPTRWSAVAYPVPTNTNVQIAVSYGDSAGNESAWNPIDVYYEFAGAPCAFT